MFGGGSRKSKQQVKFRGQDFNAELHLSLADVYRTDQRTLTVNGKNIRITIPAGIENGQTIRIKGYGSPGMNSGPAGDLYINFRIAADSQFRREGNDLYTTAAIDLYTALLGGEVMIPTIDGKLKVTVKHETQNGTRIRLKGKGFPAYKNEGVFGDLYVTYSISLPANLSEHEKELFRELSKLRSHGT